MPPSRPFPRVQTPAIDGFDKEAVLIEILHTGLDLRTKAAEGGLPMLTYLVDVLVARTREELHAVAGGAAVSRRKIGVPEDAF